MSDESRVSLAISVWNRRDDLRENLDAIRSQTVSPFEVVVVDNASNDGTAEMVREEFPEVRLIRMPHPRTLRPRNSARQQPRQRLLLMRKRMV